MSWRLTALLGIKRKLAAVIEDTGLDTTPERVLHRFRRAYFKGYHLQGPRGGHAEGKARAYGSLPEDFRRDGDWLAGLMLRRLVRRLPPGYGPKPGQL